MDPDIIRYLEDGISILEDKKKWAASINVQDALEIGDGIANIEFALTCLKANNSLTPLLLCMYPGCNNKAEGDTADGWEPLCRNHWPRQY